MAERRTRRSQLRPVPADQVAPQDQVEQQRGYRIGEWCGERSYHCLRCPMGTLSQDEIERHVCRPATTREG